MRSVPPQAWMWFSCLKRSQFANYHLISKRQLLSPLLAFLNCRFCHLSNKRNTRRSSAPPPWCSPTPEAGRWAASSSQSPIPPQETSDKRVFMFGVPPGPQAAERAEIPKEVWGGSDHHRRLLARHAGTGVMTGGVDQDGGWAWNPSFCLKLWLFWGSRLAAWLCQRSANQARPDYCRCRFLFIPFLILLITQLPLLLPLPLLSLSLFLSFSLLTLDLSRETPAASRQARTELRRLKQEVRNKQAVTVIWAYWQGTKVFQPQLWRFLSHCLVIPVFPCPVAIPVPPWQGWVV